MQILLQLSFSLVGGLLMSRLAKKLNLPAVTAYLVAKQQAGHQVGGNGGQV